MNCFRCNKELVRPDATNADYITAEDTQVMERQESAILGANGRPLTRKVPVIKTAIICPECYRPDDVVIWGVHKCED
jgi:hypothetical protein